MEIGASIFFTDYSMAQHSTAPLLDRGKPLETSHTTGQGKRVFAARRCAHDRDIAGRNRDTVRALAG